MVKRQEKDNGIPMRQPQKKGGTFDNLRTFPAPHPVEEILGLEGENDASYPHENEVERHKKEPEKTSELSTLQQHTVSLLATQQQNSSPQKQLASYPQRGDRHDKSRVQLNTRISPESNALLESKTGKGSFTKQEFIELAIHHFAEWLTIHTAGNVDMLAHDELMSIFKTSDDIIRLYFSITGNKWKASDDREAMRFNSADIRAVERGFLATAIRSTAKKINSFRYFVTEIEIAIEEFQEVSDEVKTISLASARRWWEKKRNGKL